MEMNGKQPVTCMATHRSCTRHAINQSNKGHKATGASSRKNYKQLAIHKEQCQQPEMTTSNQQLYIRNTASDQQFYIEHSASDQQCYIRNSASDQK